ncbi:glutamate decarboxylase, partial [Shigella dysenteriae]
KTNDLTYIFVKSVTEENWQRMGKTVITLSPVTRTPGRI